MQRIWVVEMFFEDCPESGWQSSAYVGITRDTARERQKIAALNAGVRTRIRKYVCR